MVESVHKPRKHTDYGRYKVHLFIANKKLFVEEKGVLA